MDQDLLRRASSILTLAMALSACGGAPPPTTDLASLEERYVQVRETQPDEALALVDEASRTAVVANRDNYRRLRYLAGDIPAPGAEPEWFYPGITLAALGALGAFTSVIGGLAGVSCSWGSGSCSGGSADGLLIGVGISGGLVVLGGVFVVLGLVLHTFDEDRRAFSERRRDVVLGMRARYQASVPAR